MENLAKENWMPVCKRVCWEVGEQVLQGVSQDLVTVGH